MTYRQQFGDPTKIGTQLNQQFNNGNGGDLAPNQVEKIEQLQHLIECLDAGMTPDQEEQQGIIGVMRKATSGEISL